MVASPKSTSYARRCFAAACDYIVSHMLHQEVWGLRLTWLVGKGAADLIPANEALERDEDLRILDCSTTLAFYPLTPGGSDPCVDLLLLWESLPWGIANTCEKLQQIGMTGKMVRPLVTMCQNRTTRTNE